jgi:histidyl-tRNA synthetase
LFTAAGTLSPQTLDRVYSFLDWDGWSGERVVLRPDSTIPAARLYAEHLDGGQVAKLFYSQNVFRFTDDGSDREETQCGVELIGDTGSAGDVEVVMMALAALKPLSLSDITVGISHAGVVRAVLAAADLAADEQAAAYDRLLDGDLTVVDEVEARLPQLNAPLRMLFEVDGAGEGYITNLRGPLVTAIPSLAGPFDELERVVAALEASGVTPRIKAVLARSFEYYSGIVMRIESQGQRIVAGGRYDELIALVGGVQVPASGFALYVTPIVELMQPSGSGGAPSVVMRTASHSSAGIAGLYAAADQLREAGIIVETVEGMHSDPTCQVMIGEDGRFAVEDGGEYADLGALIASLHPEARR